MSENVVPLRAAETLVDFDVVEMLEHLLQEANAGRIRGLIFTSILDGAQIGSAWVGGAIDDNVFATTGALAALQARFVAAKGLDLP